MARLRQQDRGEGRADAADQEARALRAGRPVDADDRRRRRDIRRRHPADQRPALRQLPSAPRLLFRLQPDPGFVVGAAAEKPPLMREHRLYQADWLMRFYGFAQAEILPARRDGMLDLAIDPEARLGAAQPRAVSRSTSTAPTARCCCACRASAPRRSKRILRDAAPPAAAAGGCRPALPVDRQGAALHRRRRLVAGRPDRQAGPARDDRALLRAAVAVLTMQPAAARPRHATVVGSPARPISPAGAMRRGGWR